MRPLIVIFLIFIFSSVSHAERYEYSAQVNRYIPEGDSAGIRDTIFIPIHLQITDINFYVGVGNEDQPWGTVILIDVFSPGRARVRLHDSEPHTYFLYNIWYDTQRQESGPGQLEDYAGGDAYGPWEMYCFDPFEGQSLTWYTWRIEVYGTPLSATDETNNALPKDYAISGVYPNPFNSSVAIEYSVPEISQVKLEVFDICGRKARSVQNGEQAAGYYRAVWDGTDISGAKASSGVYLFRLSAGDRQVAVSRATMVK